MQLLYLLVLVLFGCSTHSSAMTQPQYDSVVLGTPVSELTDRLGQPYAVHDRGNGIQEYEYIERISMNNELVYENHYFLTVVNGQIVNKNTRQENRPPYDQMYQQDPNYPTYP